MELDDFRKSPLLQSSRGSYTSPALALPATPLWTCRRGTIASNHSPTTSEYPSPDRAEKYRSFFVPSKGGSTKDARTALQEMSEKSKSIHADMKKASARMKVITGIQNAVADCQTHKAVHDKYLKIGWKARQAAFAESHKDELDSFNKAFRYLKKQGVDLNVNLDSLQAEYSNLQETYAELAGQLATAKEELQPMKDIRYWVSKVLMPEQSEVEKKPEPKHSVTEKIKFLQEQSSNQQEQKSRQHKKQNMEL